MNDETRQASFYGLGIAPRLLDVLQSKKFTVPTPIQGKAIPVAIQGKDMIGIAQTGTGKTLAFSVPMIQRLAATKGKGLVLLPTRELALQVDEVLVAIGSPLGLRTAVLIGGASMNNQIAALKKKPHVIVATPGRLIDHLEQRTVTLDEIRVLVLDEADRMLDMGFAPQIRKILARVPKERQTMLFSATMPPEISKLANEFMRLPYRIEVAAAGTTAERVNQELFVVAKNDKTRLLERILEEYKGTVLVFSRTKHGAKKLTRSVKAMGHSAAEIHANRSLAQRKEALEGFKNGRYRVLVATDIAARGIDVTGIELVVNYDLPDRAEDYVHRIGRTGRAGRAGKAISFATPDEHRDVRDIERLVKLELKRSPLPGGLPPARQGEPTTPQRTVRGGRGNANQGRGRRDQGTSRGPAQQRTGGRRKPNFEAPPRERGPLPAHEVLAPGVEIHRSQGAGAAPNPWAKDSSRDEPRKRQYGNRGRRR